MLSLAAMGACLLAILGPSQPFEPSDRALYKPRSSYVMLAKQLAPAPRHLALNSLSEMHTRAGAKFASTSVLVEAEAAPPKGAPTSIDVVNPGTVSEGGIEAAWPRANALKRYARPD